MFSVKATLWGLFNPNTQARDREPFNGQPGTLERFQNVLGEDFDESLLPRIRDLLDNTLEPFGALPEFIPYLESMVGFPPVISDQFLDRRKLLAFTVRINQIRGTKRSYEILFKFMGFSTVTIAEHFEVGGFDSANTFDDPERRFDEGRCRPCSDYSIALTGPFPLTQQIRRFAFNIVDYCEPINARLRDITYNGDALVDQVISVSITPAGDLEYNNDLDPKTTLSLDSNGDLHVHGPRAQFYSITPAGDLLFNTTP